MKNALKVYRASLNLTQEQLANRVQVTRQTIIAIESGKYSPSLELAFNIARVFHTTIEELFSPDDAEGLPAATLARAALSKGRVIR